MLEENISIWFTFVVLFDVDEQRADSEVDNLVRHLVDRGSGPFRDLVQTVDSEYGIDIIPEHNMLERLGDALRREADQRETLW
jgi:cellulose biosynthesis protein BcsQ